MAAGNPRITGLEPGGVKGTTLFFFLGAVEDALYPEQKHEHVLPSGKGIFLGLLLFPFLAPFLPFESVH